MSKRITAAVPTKPAVPVAAAPPIHYDEAFQRQAVELWLRADQPGTQIALNWASATTASRLGNAVTTVPRLLSAPNWPPQTAPSEPSWPACANRVTF
jgi:hypothetical protein